jgi:outer membrane protein assembly factor BamB
MIKLTRSVLIVIESLALLCLSSLLFGQKIEIQKEGGVTVVYNPRIPVPLDGFSTQATLKEELIIGEESDKEDYWFSYLSYLAVDDSGNIYTLDPRDIRIRVFNPTGKLIRAFGKKGQGPGEFQGPGYIVITPDGKLFISDVFNRRLTYLTLDGKLDKIISLKTLSRGVVKPDSKGFLYQHTIAPANGTMRQEMIKYDPDLNPILKIHSCERKKERGVFEPYPIVYVYDVTQDDHFIWLLTSTYEINVIDPNGKTIRRIKKDHKDIRVTKADKERYLKTHSQSFLERIRFKFPKFYPVCSRQRVDEKNRIYIRTYEKDSKGDHIVDVFDHKGRYFSRFSVPANERIYAIKKDKIYCILKDEDGIPLVKRYAIKWKEKIGSEPLISW